MDFITELLPFATLWSTPIVVVYVLIAVFHKVLIKFVPRLKPRSPLVVHNLVCTLLNVYAAVVLIIGVFQNNIFSMKKEVGVLRHGMQMYWVSKLYELLDTIFVVLKHNSKQITVMHVYYHSTLVLLADWACFVFPVAAMAPVQAMNSLIHIIMYGYFFLSLSGQYEGDLKNRLGELHILQFVVAVCYGIYGFLYHGFSFSFIPYGIIMIVLLSNNYYQKNYVQKKRE